MQTTTVMSTPTSISSPLPRHHLKIDSTIVQNIHPLREREVVGVAIDLHNQISNALVKNGDRKKKKSFYFISGIIV